MVKYILPGTLQEGGVAAVLNEIAEMSGAGF